MVALIHSVCRKLTQDMSSKCKENIFPSLPNLKILVDSNFSTLISNGYKFFCLFYSFSCEEPDEKQNGYRKVTKRIKMTQISINITLHILYTMFINCKNG